MTDVARAVCETYLAYHRLAGEVREGPACRAVRNDATPMVWDANHLQIGPADTDADADRALAFLEAELGHHAHRQIMTTPFLAPALAARLAPGKALPTSSWIDLARRGRHEGQEARCF